MEISKEAHKAIPSFLLHKDISLGLQDQREGGRAELHGGESLRWKASRGQECEAREGWTSDQCSVQVGNGQIFLRYGVWRNASSCTGFDDQPALGGKAYLRDRGQQTPRG